MYYLFEKDRRKGNPGLEIRKFCVLMPALPLTYFKQVLFLLGFGIFICNMSDCLVDRKAHENKDRVYFVLEVFVTEAVLSSESMNK